MKLIISLVLICSYFAISFSQERQTISFVPVFNGHKIVLDSVIKDEDGSWIEFNTLKFYISHLALSGAKSKWIDPTSAYLIDLEDSSSWIIQTESTEATSLSFFIGIDSVTNVSGILEGDLDPIKGMFWSWNSGYINFKIEGKASNNIQENLSFEYHIGGYLPPFKTVQEVELIISSTHDTILIEIEIAELFKSEDLKNKNEIMIPGKEASSLAQMLPLLFNISVDEK